MKIICKTALCLLLCVAMLGGAIIGLTSCGKSSPTLMTLDDITVTQAQYTFLLCRAKAAYEQAGFTVKDWDTKIDLDGTTYDQYVRQQVLAETKLMMAGVALFEKEGLSLPKSTTDAIDNEIKEFIEYHGEGSKSAFNTLLATYGFNADMLREQYIFEAKYEYMKDYLYGEDGSKIAATAKQEYLNRNGVAFKQLLIRAYRYVYETDTNGDEVYYLADANNGKTNNIAYNAKVGVSRTDEFGKTLTDKNGDTIYYLANGKIAYDKENGVRAITFDATGNPVTKALSKDELTENLGIAEDLKSSVEARDFLGFEAAVAEYTDSGDDTFMGSGELCFLYTTGDNNYDYLNDIADELAEAEVGEIRIINSEYGYNVVMKYDIPENAVSNTAYAEWFSEAPSLSTRVLQYLFSNKCKDLLESVVVDNDVFVTCPNIADVSANYKY